MDIINHNGYQAFIRYFTQLEKSKRESQLKEFFPSITLVGYDGYLLYHASRKIGELGKESFRNKTPKSLPVMLKAEHYPNPEKRIPDSQEWAKYKLYSSSRSTSSPQFINAAKYSWMEFGDWVCWQFTQERFEIFIEKVSLSFG